MRIAVVTGASSGMGRCFVNDIDKDKDLDEIWVIARREDKLNELCGTTRAKIRPIALDLTRDECIGQYKNMLDSEKPDVAVLVNASGYGIFHSFTDTKEEDVVGMIDLNAKALAKISYITLPYMDRGGEIYQLGSLSSFQPVPGMPVYAATKAFVLSLSRAMNVELKDRGIRVMAVCPGWIRTEFFERAMDDATISYFNRFYLPSQVTKKALRDMKRGRDVSILGLPVRAQVLGVKLLPYRLIMKIWCNQQKLK